MQGVSTSLEQTSEAEREVLLLMPKPVHRKGTRRFCRVCQVSVAWYELAEGWDWELCESCFVEFLVKPPDPLAALREAV